MPESPFQIILLRIWAFQILDKFSCMLCQHPIFFFSKRFQVLKRDYFEFIKYTQGQNSVLEFFLLILRSIFSYGKFPVDM